MYLIALILFNWFYAEYAEDVVVTILIRLVSITLLLIVFTIETVRYFTQLFN